MPQTALGIGDVGDLPAHGPLGAGNGEGLGTARRPVAQCVGGVCVDDIGAGGEAMRGDRGKRGKFGDGIGEKAVGVGGLACERHTPRFDQRPRHARPLETFPMPYETWPQLVDGQLFFSGEALRDYEWEKMIAGIGEPSDLPIPTHEIMTAEEACRYLRLDIGRDSDAAVKALNRLVDKGLIRPCLVGKHRRYTRDELQRFIGATTERYGECR